MDDFGTHAGINISHFKFQILEVVKEKENFEIININESLFNKPLDFTADKDTIIVSQLQAAFDEIQIKQPLKSSYISFSLPQEIFYAVQLPYESALSRNDLIEELRWELSLIYPFVSSDDLAIQYFKMDMNYLNKKDTAFVIAVEKKYIRLFKDFCLNNNLSLRYIDNALIAANRLFNSMTDLANKGLVLNVLSLRNSFSLALNVNGHPSYIKIFLISRNENVSDILAKEFSRSDVKQLKGEMTNEAYISGEEISAELISQLRIASGLNFKQLNPFRNVAVKSEIANRQLIEQKYSSFTSAAGVAFRLA